MAAQHNALCRDARLRFSSGRPGPAETTSYTGMAALPGGRAVLLSYDRLAAGWEPAPFPPKEAGDLSALFTMRVNITRRRGTD